MTEAANWIIKNWQSVTSSMILAAVSLAFLFGRLWSHTTVMLMRADFEQRHVEKTKDCEYQRVALERTLGELERTITANKILASKVTS